MIFLKTFAPGPKLWVLPSIIGIESSCDETSVAVLKEGRILSNIIADQRVHAKFGGVVPEMASREHLKNIVPVYKVALKEAGITESDLDAIAYTNGPGLLGPLMVGSSFAKGLSISTGLPLIPVNHMEAHVLAHFIEEPFPENDFLCLTASGGHTQLVLKKGDELELLGETIDDAAGEAFDKIGKMLGLDYPAGPEIDRLAKAGDGKKFGFPIIEVDDLNYSFSGLKTHVLYYLRDHLRKDRSFIEKNLKDLAASVQKTIVETLLVKMEKAAMKKKVRSVGIAGGVAANSALQKALSELCDKNGWKAFTLENQYCTDNAAMIAMVGAIKFRQGNFGDLDLVPAARWKF